MPLILIDPWLSDISELETQDEFSIVTGTYEAQSSPFHISFWALARALCLAGQRNLFVRVNRTLFASKIYCQTISSSTSRPNSD